MYLTLNHIFIVDGLIVFVGRDDSALACWVVGICATSIACVVVTITVGVDKVLFGDVCTFLIGVILILRVLPHDVQVLIFVGMLFRVLYLLDYC